MVNELPDNRRPRPLLSDHEQSVIWLAAQGLTPEEIGFQLGMSPIAVRALAAALRRVLQDTPAATTTTHPDR
jgi:DNA-binding CsgD family transcriptional regulator